MLIKKRVVYYGYLAKGFLPVLQILQNKFAEADIEFLILFTSINEIDAKNKNLGKLNYINFNHFYFSRYEELFEIMNADFYIMWGGYDEVLAHYRHYLNQNKIPYFLCEYTGIKDLYHFDTALNGESEFVRNVKMTSSKTLLSDCDDLLKSRIETPDLRIEDLESIKQKYGSVISYFAMWDCAAGLNETNSTETQAYISKYYLSSYSALLDLYSHLPTDTVLLIKSHPHESEENKFLFNTFADQKQNVIYLTHQYTAAQIIEISDVVCTIASTVNLIALYQKKPLVLLGKTYIASSRYAYQIDEYNNLSECLRAAINKEEWDMRLNERSSFFSNFLLNAEVFSADAILIQNGVKSIKQLSDSIAMKLTKFINTNSLYFPFYALTKRLLIEIKGINYLLSDRTKQLENILTDLDQTRTDLVERTQRLVNAENELVERTQTLVSTETELAECTKILESTLTDLEQTRAALVEQIQRLESTTTMLEKYKKAKLIVNGKIIL